LAGRADYALFARLTVSPLTPPIDYDDPAWLAIVPQIAGVPVCGLGLAVGSTVAFRHAPSTC